MFRSVLSSWRAVPTQSRGFAFGRSSSRFVNEETLIPKLVLHCKFTNNNTILTLSRRVNRQINSSPAAAGNEQVINQAELIQQIRPEQEVITTVSAGQLGFRGTKKDSFDAAFQTTARMFQRIEEKKLTGQSIELIMRNFGQNREAFFKVLFGKEGTRIRPSIKRVTDGTKIKFGGDRAPNRRRV